MRPALVERLDGRLNHVCRCVKIGFPDLQMHDLFALSFQGFGLVQNLEGRLGAQPRHARGKAKLVLGGSSRFHAGKGRHYTSRAAALAAMTILCSPLGNVRKRKSQRAVMGNCRWPIADCKSARVARLRNWQSKIGNYSEIV